LAFERRWKDSSDQHHGTLLWNEKNKHPTGLHIDMSKMNLLSTLQNINASTEDSQSETLDCPTGFKLEKIQERRMPSFESPNIKTEPFFCIICSRDEEELSYSSCIGESKAGTIGSFYLPSLFFNGPCEQTFTEGPDGCEINMSRDNKLFCGIRQNPDQFNQFIKKFGDLQEEELESNCPGLRGIS